MGLNLEEKKALVAEVGAKVAQAQAIVLAEYRSLKVGRSPMLRAKARGAGVYFRVLKNTLARRAVADTPFAGLAQHMTGPLVYGISPDPVAVAKVLNDFAKGNDKLVIRAGAMPNQVMSAKEIATLASLPSRWSFLASSWEPCRRRSPSSRKRSTKCRASLCAPWPRSGMQREKQAA